MSSVSATPLDPKVSAVLEQKNAARSPDDLDEDALFEALEKEDDSAYREHRMEQLHSELASAKEALLRTSSETNPTQALYPTLPNDQSVLDLTTNNSRCVIHFAHPDFVRCSVMDEHLRMLASRHYEVRFARVDVRSCPFVVEKLNIRVLPCVVGFIDSLGKDRIVGFEGLGSVDRQQDGADGFQTADLEKRLLKNGVLVREKLTHGGGQHNRSSDSEDDTERRRRIRSGNARHNNGNKTADDDDDDDDWD